MADRTRLPSELARTVALRWTEDELASSSPISATLRGDPAGTASGPGRLPPFTIADSDPGVRGPYVQLGVLGEGGMGVVYEAQDTVLDRVVALKRPLAQAGPQAATSLVVEARTLARLDHPNIVPVHALGVDEAGQPVLAMKRVTGRRWSDLVHDGIDLDRELSIALHVCDALRFAHDRGIVHRDVKPENVMVGAFGEVYLMDWGCAGTVGGTSGEIVGTPGYLAPEMLETEAVVGAFTDVFLLGATLHRILTGENRNAGRNLGEVLYRAWECRPATYPPQVPAEIASILDRACARAAADRYPDMAGLAAALRDHREHRTALSLAAAGLRHVEALEKAIAEHTPRIEAIYLQARTDLLAALAAWEGCTPAREALDRAHAAYIPWKLAAGEVASVESLLAELPASARSRWEGDVERVRAERTRISLELHDNDLTVAARARRNLAALVLVVGLLLAGAVANFRGHAALGARDVAVLGMLGVVMFGGAAWVFRKHVFANRASSRIMGGVLVAVSGSAVLRAVAWLANASPADSLRNDALFQAGCLFITAMSGEPGIALTAIPYLIVAAIMAVRPDLAGALFPFGAIPAIFIGGVVFLRRDRRGGSN